MASESERPSARAHLALAPDARVVDQAVEHIRAILGRTLACGMEEVGAYLLKAFYDDDPARYGATGQSRHISLRALVERCGTMELPVSASFLSTSIRIAVIARRLPSGANFTKLPVSHRVELLRLPEDRIEPVATETLKARLAVRELRTRVRKMLSAKPSTRGRPRTPKLIRVSSALERALVAEDGTPIAVVRADAVSLSAEQKVQLRNQIGRARDLLRRLEEVVAAG